MNSYGRVIRRLEHELVEKIPNLNIGMIIAAKYTSVPYEKLLITGILLRTMYPAAEDLT